MPGSIVTRAIGVRALRTAAITSLMLLAITAHANPTEPGEPPPESPEGADYEAEPADTLEDGSIEIGLGAAGRMGQHPQPRRRVRFNSDSLGATFREGNGDALSGGTIEGRAWRGSFGIGRLAPRWGRGLLLGAAAEPWAPYASDRGLTAGFRGRAGRGAWLRGGKRVSYEALAGRFTHRSISGARLGLGVMSLGVVTNGRGELQTGAAVDGDDMGSEVAFDASGLWRAEVAFTRRVGPGSLVARARGGSSRFRSLAEPKRSGPAQVLAVNGTTPVGPIRMAGLGALWRFKSAVVGARAGLEAELKSRRHGDLGVGVEEQHGIRRLPDHGLPHPAGIRQGWWIRWRGGTERLALTLRQEQWGVPPWARQSLRSALSARVQVQAPANLTLRATHTIFVTRRGESIYLPESDSDRMTLRALSGAGERTRFEVRVPAARGLLLAALNLSSSSGQSIRSQWRLDWVTHARIRRE